MLSKLLIVKMARRARMLRPVLLMLVTLLALVANVLTPFHPRLQVAEAQVACCNVNVPGTSDLWLAGMPDGSTASGGDVAPTHSPVLVSCLPLTAGFLLSFTVSGAVSNGPCCPQVGPDGAAEATFHLTGAENGISDTGARLNSLIGVFLGPDRPDLSQAPSTVDWTIPVNDYTLISPALKQVFFIGDGRSGSGEVQKVVIPSGATRLYLGTMDGTGWFNNTGSFSVTACSEPAQQPTPSCATSSIPGTSDLWLAGMPNGTTASGPTTGDVAPDHSPVLSGLTLAGGDTLNFTNITGAVSNGPCCAPIGPEGGEITPHLAGAENGISNLIAPINSLIGVFLGADLPSNSIAPATLDFSNAASRDFTTLSPLLKQAFFIGNGTTSGGTVQQFVVPMGATRLFVGTMDGTGWFNNTGSFSVTVCKVTEQPPPTTRTLTVASSNPDSGVTITVSPNDNGGQGNGVTPFTRTYNNNTVVTLTAPATAGGNNFQKWQRDGVDVSTSLTTTVTMDANHTMTAVYAAPPPPTGFNICIQDDGTSSFLKIKSSTGEYFFESCRGQTLSGKGNITVRGATITLVHNTPDRRVNAEVDISQKKGNAGVQIIALALVFSLTDRNITDNPCVCIR